MLTEKVYRMASNILTENVYTRASNILVLLEKKYTRGPQIYSNRSNFRKGLKNILIEKVSNMF